MLGTTQPIVKMNYNCQNVDEDDDVGEGGGMENSSLRELIFIQAGPASNWVGSHFWNLQEGRLLGGPKKSLFSPSVLYRIQEESSHSSSSLGLRPRVLAMDVLGSVRSPHLETGAESNATRSVTVAWDGAVQTVAKKDTVTIPKSSANQIERQPRFWTDCLLTTSRRRWRGEESLQVIRDYLDASSPGDTLASPFHHPPPTSSKKDAVEPFESPSYLSTFTQGLNLFRSGGAVFDIFEDYFHRIVEECDRPSGFVLSVDSDSGFAGVGLRVGEYINEEFAKRPIFTAPIASVPANNKFARRWSTVCLNRLALYTGLERAHEWSSCSTWLPLYSPPQNDGACYSGALLASGLATLFTPLQLRPRLQFATDLYGVITKLTPTRKRMLSLSISCQSPPYTFPAQPKWLHVNPLSLSATKNGKQNIHANQNREENRPISFVSQLATCGVNADITEGILAQWTKEGSVGTVCSLGNGLEGQITACLPENPLYVPRIQSSQSLCSQATLTRSATLVEAVSHWSNEDQWLACGLRQHLLNAFIDKFHTDLETDDLRERKENAIDSLVEAYASPDG